MTMTHTNGYGHKRNHPIEAQIERLGQLNDRRLLANERGDLIELQQIARPCVTMAKEIRVAISIRLKKGSHEEVQTHQP
jgi:hypothetical protein